MSKFEIEQSIKFHNDQLKDLLPIPADVRQVKYHKVQIYKLREQLKDLQNGQETT